MADHDLAIVASIISFLTSCAFINLLLPITAQFMTMGSLLTFGTTTTITAGMCVLSTGLPCAIALGFGSILNLLGTLLNGVGIDIAHVPIINMLAVTSPYQWVGTLILTPISVILTIFIAKLARGN